LDDIYGVEVKGVVKLYYLKEPINKIVKASQQLSDITNLWKNVMEPCFKNDETPLDVETLPLYMKKLRNGLKVAKESDVNSNWFYDYVIYHPAFASSVARRNFVVDTNTTYKSSSHFKGNSSFDALFEEDTKELWRKNAARHPVLQTTFNYRSDEKKMAKSFTLPYEVIVQEKLDNECCITYKSSAKVAVFKKNQMKIKMMMMIKEIRGLMKMMPKLRRGLRLR
jgi:hypothetical protein